MKPVLGRFAEPAYALLRIVAGLMFAMHGAQKLLGVFGGQTVPMMTQPWFAGVIELVEEFS
jgi:putative oxidoreductase